MKKSKVFVIMPFQDEFLEMYEMLKVKLQDRFEFTNAGDEGNQQNILQDIIQPIYEADMIIADLTGLNANVMYELGLAHSFNKKTIIITKDDIATLPFDLKQYRVKDYDTHFIKFDELIDFLKSTLTGASDGTVLFSNPVKDFLKLGNINDIPWFNEDNAVIEIEDDSDKGFIDFLADLETSTEEFNDSVNSLSNDIETMSDGVGESTKEIERVKQAGGSGTAAFMRKASRKAAKYVEDFSSSLKAYNKDLPELWNKIEMNTMGLLENEYASSDNNRDMLIEYLKTLFETKNSIYEAEVSVTGLKTEMQGVIGLEKSLTKAMQFAVADLTNFLKNTEYFRTSIDKILNKSKFTVGEINFEED